ncbi:MAG: FAD-binding protein [Alphaproteobacteria bacterium]|nr:FAD-binding protein [Alphaproteobacteria bacterium]
MNTPNAETVLAALTDALGADYVLTDEDARAYFSTDLFYEGTPPCAVISPGSTEQLAEAIKEITDAGLAVVPRGGGLSYSAGYLANRNDAVVVDTRRLNRIVEINEEDMFVTVETGVTWADLDATLAERGLRTPFWGTGSGKHATVGATLSQNGINYGSGQYGFAAQSAIGLDIVTADGSVIATGTGGNDKAATPFLRHYGPDLVGLFIGDCGALGIKATATLQLLRRPAITHYAAYEYESSDHFCDALSEIARCQVVSECFGFDPGFTSMRTTYAGIKDDLKLLGGVAKSAESLGKGLVEAFKVAAAGRTYLEGVAYSIHITVDGRDEADAASRLSVAKNVLGERGTEIEASVPKVMRGTPFPDPTIILGHNGELWVPMHGIVPHSQFKLLLKNLDQYMDDQKDIIEKHNIAWALTMVPAGPSGVLVEPNLYWRDKRSAMMESYLPDSYLDQKQRYETDTEAKAAVRNLREGMVDVFRALGAAHLQIGRIYPYLESRSPAVQALLRALKAQLDPQGCMNPGSLGL